MSTSTTPEINSSREQLTKQLSRLTLLTDDQERIDHANALVDTIVQLEKLIPGDPTCWEQAVKLAFTVAEHAKNESIRKPYGEANVIGALKELFVFPSAPEDFKVQALRAFGNLCFDEDENRQRVMNAELIPLILPLLDTNSALLNKNVCGFCLNSSMDYEPIETAIAEHGGIARLSALLTPEKVDTEPDMVYLAINTLRNVISPEDAEKRFTSGDLIQFISLATFFCEERNSRPILQEWSSRVLSLMGSLLDMVVSIVDGHDDLTDDLAEYLLTNQKVEVLLDFIKETDGDKKDPKELEEVKESISKVIVYAFGSDKHMKSLFKNEALLQRLFRDTCSENDILMQTVFGAISNLARTDEHCVALVTTHHLEKHLLTSFKGTENALTHYVILSCIKQLCLPVENRSIIGDAGTIEIIAPFLDTSKDMLKRNQFFTIGILRNLSDRNYGNAERIMQGKDESILGSLLAFIKRVDDVGALSEATRVLMNLVKTVWKEEGVDTLEMRNQLARQQVVSPIIALIRATNFPLLKNDGAITMTLLLTSLETDSLAEVLSAINAPPPDDDEEKRTFLQVVIDDVCSDALPEKTRCNLCTLLENAVKATQSLPSKQNTTAEMINGVYIDRLASLDDKTLVGSYARHVVDACGGALHTTTTDQYIGLTGKEENLP